MCTGEREGAGEGGPAAGEEEALRAGQATLRALQYYLLVSKAFFPAGRTIGPVVRIRIRYPVAFLTPRSGSGMNFFGSCISDLRTGYPFFS